LAVRVQKESRAPRRRRATAAKPAPATGLTDAARLEPHPMLVKRLGSTVFWIFLVISSLLLFPIAVLIWALTVLVDKRLVILHQFTCFWASLYSWFNPVWRVTIEGREKIAAHTAYVMVANHMSLLDILVLFRLFVHFKWVSKIENFRVPFIGWNMSLNRYIKLRRGDKESVEQMMAACERTLAEGSSIMMFPEGTRSVDGRLKQFKHGAFTLAHRMHLPILPIVIEGTAAALPKRGFILQGRHAIRIRVLDAIPYARFASQSVEALTEQVRNVFVAELGEESSSGHLSVASR
jgi:1-acyl-sn-glycerol-3-phosphate acyltransferase